MDMGVSVDVDDSGLPVAVKVASTDDERQRLAHQAEVLAQLARPGVVRLLDHDTEAGQLVTAWQPGSPLSAASTAAKPLVQQLQYVADTASIIDSIHLDGWTHGSLDADHVIVTGTNSVVLCGFSRSASLEANPDEHSQGIRRDVDGLVNMTRCIADEHLRRASARPRRIALPGRVHEAARPTWLSDLEQRWQRTPQLTAHEVARSLTAALPRVVTARPPAKRLGGVLQGSTLQRSTRQPSNSVGRRAKGAGLAMACLGGVAVGALILATLSNRGSTAQAQPITPATLPRPLPDTAPPSTPATAVKAPAATTAPTAPTAPTVMPATSASTTTAPIDPCARCLPDARIDGAITVDGRTYRIASDADDIVVMGDWDCDRIATPAVLHLPSGDLDRFDTWATDEADAVATRVHSATNAIGITADPHCGPPQLVTAPLDPAAARPS
jgi:predicted Ser/Thr protein kinase